MNLIWAIFFILGGFSTGYSLLRTGFPNALNWDLTRKLIPSFIIGAIVFGLPALITQGFGISSNYYFLICLIVFALIGILLYAKRVTYNETDPLIEKQSKRRTAIPEKVLTKEERERKGIGEAQGKAHDFEHGLLVKTVKVVKPEDVKKQVFKEKNTNVIRDIDKKTKELENREKEKQKNEILKKLRASAKEIDEEAEKEETEEIEEDLLNRISE